MGISSSSADNPEYQEGGDADMNEKEPKPGDLIEIFRGIYKHWALYVGSGNVIHFVVNQGVSCCSSVEEELPDEMGVVMKEKLQEVVAGSKWKINNNLDKKYKHKEIYDIIKMACSLNGVRLPYNVMKSNCEHFVNDLRYGKPESRQVFNAEVGLGLGGALAGFTAIVVGTVIGLVRR